MKIPNIRLLNQQLLSPLFFQPKELVSWMGAMQAQNYSMVKWAVGMRLKSATIQTVDASDMASRSSRRYPVDVETFRRAYYIC